MSEGEGPHDIAVLVDEVFLKRRDVFHDDGVDLIGGLDVPRGGLSVDDQRDQHRPVAVPRSSTVFAGQAREDEVPEVNALKSEHGSKRAAGHAHGRSNLGRTGGMEAGEGRDATHEPLDLIGEVGGRVHAGKPVSRVLSGPIEQTVGRHRFDGGDVGRSRHQATKRGREVGVVAGFHRQHGRRQAGEPCFCRGLVLQGHPLHGMAGRSAVGLGAEQRDVVGGKVRLREQRGLVARQAFPGGFLLQIAGFDGLDQADKIHGCTVFVLDLVEQVDAGVIGEETVLTAVKNEVLRT